MSVWAIPTAVLGLGLLVGMVLVFFSRGRRGRDHLAELTAVKDSLLDQLRSLEADKAKLAPAIFEDRWARLLDQAAAAVRDLERERVSPTPEQTKVEAEAHGGRRPWGTMVGALVFFALLGVGLVQYSAPRQEGGSLTGTDLSGAAQREAQIEAAKATLEENPDDIDALNLITYQALATGNLGEAMKWMDRCRKVAPEHPEVRTHLAILQMSIGMTDKAKTELDAALEIDPNLSKALLWRGMASVRSGERTKAVGFLERALENASTPDERRSATQALAEARRPPPKVMLRGSLGLAQGLTKPQGGVLFVMVRRSEAGQGPPIAAVRLDPRGVPGTFSVTDRDMMMGGTWPEQVWVEARIDTDGNPMTKSDSDLVANLSGPHGPGATGVVLELGGAATPPGSNDKSAAKVSGTITLAKGTKLVPGSTVFLIVRRSETPKGPPAAAVRMPLSRVPGPFSVGDADLMMGGSWPEDAWLQVRADVDGNAMTRSEGDVSSPVVGPVPPGQTGVVLKLSRE